MDARLPSHRGGQYRALPQRLKVKNRPRFSNRGAILTLRDEKGGLHSPAPKRKTEFEHEVGPRFTPCTHPVRNIHGSGPSHRTQWVGVVQR